MHNADELTVVQIGEEFTLVDFNGTSGDGMPAAPHTYATSPRASPPGYLRTKYIVPPEFDIPVRDRTESALKQIFAPVHAWATQRYGEHPTTRLAEALGLPPDSSAKIKVAAKLAEALSDTQALAEVDRLLAGCSLQEGRTSPPSMQELRGGSRGGAGGGGRGGGRDAGWGGRGSSGPPSSGSDSCVGCVGCPSSSSGEAATTTLHPIAPPAHQNATAVLAQPLPEAAKGPQGPLLEAAPAKPAKRARPTPAKCCAVCGGSTGVHRHRKLGVTLDDRCRKQVETFQQGHQVCERRTEWIAFLRTMPTHELAQRMLRELEAAEAIPMQRCMAIKKRKAELLQAQAHPLPACALPTSMPLGTADSPALPDDHTATTVAAPVPPLLRSASRELLGPSSELTQQLQHLACDTRGWGTVLGTQQAQDTAQAHPSCQQQQAQGHPMQQAHPWDSSRCSTGQELREAWPAADGSTLSDEDLFSDEGFAAVMALDLHEIDDMVDDRQPGATADRRSTVAQQSPARGGWGGHPPRHPEPSSLS